MAMAKTASLKASTRLAVSPSPGDRSSTKRRDPESRAHCAPMVAVSEFLSYSITWLVASSGC
jgi:hypothetical protein